jgi:hypothetical protein
MVATTSQGAQNALKIKQVLITARLRPQNSYFSTLFIAHQLLPVKSSSI